MTDGVDSALSGDVETARGRLRSWYRANRREFPWRETTDPYPILVSEVMSQQTQLDRIVEPWEEFLGRWPTVGALAGADRADVVAFWSEQRLGYNNRARYLHEAAGQIVDEFDGEFPDAVVDTNVKRVLHRAFGVPDDDAAFEAAANELMPSGESREWNNAIMELGGTVCGKQPRCDEAPCPWRGSCDAYESGDFTAPDVPTQPSFEGSRRQFRGRVVRALGEHGEQAIDELGPRVRVDYTPDGEHGREWLRGLVDDLVDDGLVEVDERGGEAVASLAR